MATKKHLFPSPTSLTTNIFILVLFGLIILASASSVVGYTDFGSNYYYLKHQFLFGFLPGLFLFLLLSKTPYKFWQKYAGLLLISGIGLLLLVFVPGIGATYNKARSWINLGIFSIQPSEIMKLILIIYLATWLSRSDSDTRRTKSEKNIKSFSHGLLPFLILLTIISGLIALQPDIGTMIIITLVAIGVYFIAGLKWSHLLSLILLGAGFVAVLIKIAPYRLNRILAFINPSADTQGIGYHINQALLAVGSGGWFGLGLGKSRQKFEFLPQVSGDSIFAIMAEELGFILCTLFIVFFIYFIFKILKISKLETDEFARLFTAGLAIWLGGQALINIGAMVGILPLTGIPLPFISYGGTSLIAILAGCGILINIAKSQSQ